MQFTQLLSAITLTILAVTSEGLAQVTYRGYSSTVECSGSNFWCRDGGAVCCGPFPAGFGYSAQFESLPLGTQGQGYTDACSAFRFAVFGPGTKCWNGGGARSNYLNWFHSAGRQPSGDGSGAGCVAPSGFTYHDDKGVERHIRIPTGQANATEVIAQKYVNKDWQGLSAYQTF
ncbi:hypothetical protein NMY22_g718 [Coprinellus aureogranulatus]|nr:hypothetical protein NMY22_g718 [Coprinellus aureogranulatus]